MATRKKTSNTRGGRSAKRGSGKTATPVLHLSGTANDIVGLAVAVVAVAMGVALLMPSSAPVTRLTGEALVMLFGAGALLIPAALLIFALTFFVDDDEPLTRRVALGLALVTIAILSIASITMPGAEADSGLVLTQETLRGRGGYLGGGIAWALLQTVGREVGIVVLVGVAVS